MRSLLFWISLVVSASAEVIDTSDEFSDLARKHFGEEVQDAALFNPKKDKVPPIASVVCHVDPSRNAFDAAAKIKKSLVAFAAEFYSKGSKVELLEVTFHVLGAGGLENNDRKLAVSVSISAEQAARINWKKPAAIVPSRDFKTTAVDPAFKPLWLGIH